MKVNLRFPNAVVWGGILLLMLIVIGCSLPNGSDVTETPSDSSSQDTRDGKDDESGQQTPGKNQDTQDGTDDEGGQQTPGETQDTQDGTDDEGGQQTPGENQNTQDGTDDEGGQQTPGENQNTQDGESGFLSWNINYPAEKVWGAVLTASLKIDEDTFIPYTHFDLTGSGAENQKASLPPGTYRIEARFLSHNVETGSNAEIVRIYPGQETKSTQVTIPGTGFPDPQEFSSVGALKEYLSGRPENTRDTPYPIKIATVDLSSKGTQGETLNTLYDALNQRYVTLDLRGCTGTDLIAASTARITNRANVVSLVLPDSIIEIKANGFSGYTNLQSVVIPKAKTINTSAFKNCEQLETVFATKLETIAEAKDNASGAFAGCTSLKTLYCPSLVTMGKYAVYGCTSLTGAAFPRLQTLGGLAFKRCTALKSVSLPSVTKLESGGFEEDTALTYLIFGATPPELETTVFRSANFSQSGVIFVPPDAVDAYKKTSHANWTNLKTLVKALPDPAVL